MNLTKAIFFFPFLLAVSFFSAQAGENMESNILTVAGFSPPQGRWIEKDENVGHLLKEIALVQFKAISPHPFLNPEKSKSEWAGLAIRDIITYAGVSLRESDFVSIVGEDSYVTQVRAEDIQKFNIMLAIRENGVVLSKSRGGVQTVFPTEAKSLPKDYFKDPFWCWYVRKIIVGPETPTLQITLPHKNNINLATLNQRLRSKMRANQALLLKPRGSFIQPDIPKTRQKGFLLKDILSLGGNSKNAQIVLNTSLGKAIPVATLPISLENIFVVTQIDNGDPLPTYLGGPAIITSADPRERMIPLFFVQSIKVEVP